MKVFIFEDYETRAVQVIKAENEKQARELLPALEYGSWELAEEFVPTTTQRIYSNYLFR